MRKILKLLFGLAVLPWCLIARIVAVGFRQKPAKVSRARQALDIMAHCVTDLEALWYPPRGIKTRGRSQYTRYVPCATGTSSNY